MLIWISGVSAAEAAGETSDIAAAPPKAPAYPLTACAYCSAICSYRQSFTAVSALKKMSSKDAVWQCS